MKSNISLHLLGWFLVRCDDGTLCLPLLLILHQNDSRLLDDAATNTQRSPEAEGPQDSDSLHCLASHSVCLFFVFFSLTLQSFLWLQCPCYSAAPFSTFSLYLHTFRVTFLSTVSVRQWPPCWRRLPTRVVTECFCAACNMSASFRVKCDVRPERQLPKSRL